MPRKQRGGERDVRRREVPTDDKRSEIDAGRFDYTQSRLSLALRDIADCEGEPTRSSRPTEA
jgi:hypothetical protein